LRDIVRRQPLPGYRLLIEHDRRGRELLAFAPADLSTGARGQHVETHVLSGTPTAEFIKPDNGFWFA
jgi:hypothetical protein